MASCGRDCEESNCRPKSPGSENEPTKERFDRLSVTASDTKAQCTKCGEEDSLEGCNGLCTGCFRAYMYGKFKLAVTSNAMIAPTDKVLVAFSGGPASRIVLEFIHEMQSKALKSWDASNSQALPVFSVGVVFINESIFSAIQLSGIEVAIGEIRSIVSNLSPPDKELHIVPIEDVSSSSNELIELVNQVNDETGKEDFLRYLRMNSLQRVALENGYNKLVLGSSASSIARHVICSTVKGQGYSLPADIQYVDTRYKVPIILPIRDCLERELVMLCNIDRLKTQQVFDRRRTGINGLVSSFITHLREENPAREHTILRTAGKLKPFKFNKFSGNNYHDFLPSRLRANFINSEMDESSSSSSDDVFCNVCSSPLTESESQVAKGESFVSSCCETCRFQIVPQGGVSRDNFFSSLPKSFKERSLLREEIKDYLLGGDIGET